MSRQNLEGGRARGIIFDEVKLGNVTVTLAGALTLTEKSPALQFLDPGGAGRTITLPAEADSDGLQFVIVNTADNAEDLTINDDAAAQVGIIGQNEIGILLCDGTTWKSMITGTGAGLAAADITVADTGGFTAATEAEALFAELLQHLFSVQSWLPVPLFTFRETTAFDVGNIAVNGGILASDTTPVLDAINGATDGAQRLLWASTNVDQVVTQIGLPPDLDTTKDIVIHFRIVSGGTADAVGFTLASFFDEGDVSIADTSGTNQTTAFAEVTATIAAADIPAGAQTLSLGLTPVSHGTDTMALTAVWLEYSKVLLTS